MLTISTAEGAEMVNYFPLKESPSFGLAFRGLYDSQLNRRPAAKAYETTTGKLGGVTAASTLSLGTNSWGYQFTKGTTNLYVVWSGKGAIVQLPYTGGATVTDIYGDKWSAISNTVSVGPSPVFVEPWN